MNKKLNKELLEELYSKNISYKEISKITGYSISSVNGYFYKTKGKMVDSRKFVRNNIEFTIEQKEIFFGTMMGDGNIQKQKVHSYSGRFNHSIKQVKYCEYLKKCLDQLTTEIKEYRGKASNGKLYDLCYFSLKNNFKLKEFYDIFYIKDNKKDVPLDLKLLTLRAMAFWFMDDGSASSRCSISIATCSFSKEGLLRLQKFLFDKYEISTTIQKDNKLYFKAESGRKFYNLVKEYIIPEMMYKFKFINPKLI